MTRHSITLSLDYTSPITQVLPVSQDTITIRSLDWSRDRLTLR